MRPLKVALVVKPSESTRHRDDRNMGYWSYAVPEFTWEHFSLGDFVSTQRSKFSGFDFIFVEDGGNWGEFVGDGPPVVYLSIDDTLSEAHRNDRVKQSKYADLALVDHGPLDMFKSRTRHTVRWNYCVNDKVFVPLEKSIDVTFHCSASLRSGMPGASERIAIRQSLDEICKRHGWSYHSGALGLDEYAAHMGQSRVVVNWPRTVLNRPHRIFDSMACGAAVLTGPIPRVDGDNINANVHYLDYRNDGEMERALEFLLDAGHWREIASHGHYIVMTEHTWAIRARQLRELVNGMFGL